MYILFARKSIKFNWQIRYGHFYLKPHKWELQYLQAFLSLAGSQKGGGSVYHVGGGGDDGEVSE